MKQVFLSLLVITIGLSAFSATNNNLLLCSQKFLSLQITKSNSPDKSIILNRSELVDRLKTSPLIQAYWSEDAHAIIPYKEISVTKNSLILKLDENVILSFIIKHYDLSFKTLLKVNSNNSELLSHVKSVLNSENGEVSIDNDCSFDL